MPILHQPFGSFEENQRCALLPRPVLSGFVPHRRCPFFGDWLLLQSCSQQSIAGRISPQVELLIIIKVIYNYNKNLPSITSRVQGQVVFIPAYRKCFCRRYNSNNANENMPQDVCPSCMSFSVIALCRICPAQSLL